MLYKLISEKCKTGQSICRRGTDQDEQGHGSEGIEKGIKEYGGHIGVHPSLFIVLKVEAAT